MSYQRSDRMTVEMRIVQSAKGICAAPHLRRLRDFILANFPGFTVSLQDVRRPDALQKHYSGQRFILRDGTGAVVLDHSTAGTPRRNADISRWIMANRDKLPNGKVVTPKDTGG